jgi:hypothetical protein
MQSLALRSFAVLAAPVGLGVLAAIHPLVDGALIPANDLAVWTLIHTLQIPLAALLGIAVLVLLHGIHGPEAAVARLAVVPWVAAFAAFDGIAGLATGALSDFGHANPAHAGVALDIGTTLAASAVVSAALPLGAFLASLLVFGGAAAALQRTGVSTAGAAAIGFGGALWTFVHPLVGAPAMAIFAFGALVALRTEARSRSRTRALAASRAPRRLPAPAPLQAAAPRAVPTPGWGRPLMDSEAASPSLRSN